jgi:lactoylglutathione lyase/methylmalonyl-CoA/ethylmalonyl-CoA epimerase
MNHMAVFKKFDHIGIVVADLEKAMKELSHFFGLECEEQREIKEAGIRIAFYPLGTGKMELIEFQKPIDDLDSIVLEPRSGVQHVAFQVEDFDKTLKELIKKGLEVVRGFPREGAHGKVAFFYPPEGLDLMIEICEISDKQKG